MQAAENLNLFDRMRSTPPDLGLRWYQSEGNARVIDALEEFRSALLVMATGLGKSVCFSDIAVRWPGRVLLLAHRDELVMQARDHFQRATGGEWVDVEKAELRAELHTRLVVASVQTLVSDARRRRFPADHFSLIIIDEAHHATAPSYRKILDYFSEAKILGVTATPDRQDEAALGQVFDTVPWIFDIEDGIEQGYLVPLRGHREVLEEIDISEVGVSHGDLVASQLDQAMISAMEGIVKKTLDLQPDRRAIVFCPGVKSAELAMQRFNYFEPGSTIMISGGTDPDERRELVKGFKCGDFKRLCNCQIATEGFDDPTVSLIVQGRPTKSRALYAQMAGRGTRPLPGVVDKYKGREGAAQRRAAIDWSDKPDCLILDFVGNTGRHKLATVEDILGGKYTDEEIEAAKKKAKKGGNTLDALREARKEIADYAAKIKSRVKSTGHEVDLFGGDLDDEQDKYAQRFGRKPMSRNQLDRLTRIGYTEAELRDVDRAGASKLIAQADEARRNGWATVKQLRVLRRFVPVDRTVSFARASAAMNYLAQKGWGRSAPVEPSSLERILKYERQPGEEG